MNFHGNAQRGNSPQSQAMLSEAWHGEAQHSNSFSRQSARAEPILALTRRDITR